ncbi:condensation domain-containing protein [Nocardia sp. alder85J]|uniref:condensation domain-containing protein n=1 Tax=Nocardia sp. alder85J TaxID=2862949 RepID=UPI001CD47BFC|nr:condensation domain-containing protein [Nocardia sp. alder85J]MCX4091666.1 condensation domain-containing protein [Nocardia sp. alder85J]
MLLERRPRPEHVPLAPAQERIWDDSHRGRSMDWNMVRAYRIRGLAIDAAALVAAVGDVVVRHLPLRTLHPLTERGPAQVVVDTLPEVPVTATTEAELPARLAAFACHDFDLATETPIRAEVHLLGEQDAVLALVVHHIALDGASIQPLLRDLVTAYLARAAGQAPAWTPLPVDYPDYTLWKHESLGDLADPWSRAGQQLRYWSNALAGRPSRLPMPYDRPRPVDRDIRGDSVAVAFDAETHRLLLDRAQRVRGSLFMLLQTAFALALGEFTGCADVTVATAVAGRDQRALTDLVGNFSDDVLMRVRLDRALDVDDLIDQVRRVSLAGFAHPDTPNPRLLRCLPQDAEHPLFQATLILQRGAAETGHEPDGLSITEVPIGVRFAKHDFEFGLAERYDAAGAPAGIDGGLLYPVVLFDRETVAGFVDRFAEFVRQLADGCPRPLPAPLGETAARRR